MSKSFCCIWSKRMILCSTEITYVFSSMYISDIQTIICLRILIFVRQPLWNLAGITPNILKNIWIVILIIVVFGVKSLKQHRGLTFYAAKCLACKMISNIPESSDLMSPKLIRMHRDALLTSCKQPSSVSKQSKRERQITSENYSYPLFISEIDIREYDNVIWSCLLIFGLWSWQTGACFNSCCIHCV